MSVFYKGMKVSQLRMKLDIPWAYMPDPNSQDYDVLQWIMDAGQRGILVADLRKLAYSAPSNVGRLELLGFNIRREKQPPIWKDGKYRYNMVRYVLNAECPWVEPEDQPKKQKKGQMVDQPQPDMLPVDVQDAGGIPVQLELFPEAANDGPQTQEVAE